MVEDVELKTCERVRRWSRKRTSAAVRELQRRLARQQSTIIMTMITIIM